ncbi:methyltransferase domain-containing protein [Candidatus Woesearchaeota archaeon]|nr:methyltransferase domain-containing protein [Candidatus Woesearchaeota archaeon]
MEYYNSIAEGYNELYREEQLKKIESIRQRLRVTKKDRLLDVGCGTGISTEGWPCECVGIDPAKSLLARAKPQPNVSFIQGTAEHIPFPDSSFDIVISVSALHNFDDPEKALKEMKRVGKHAFAISFLKKSAKRALLESLIKKYFSVEEIIEEEKDIIFFCL